jgi:hypothetical protein
MCAHDASLIKGSAKLATPVDRSYYLARAIDKLLLLRTSPRTRPEAQRADKTSQPTDITDVFDTADRPHFFLIANEQYSDRLTAMEADTHP